VRRLACALVLVAGALRLEASPGNPPPAPQTVLGFRVGEDRKLADWRQIVDYFNRLDAASDRVRVEEVGKTTEGQPFLIATISSQANLARLEEIRRINLRLADPRGLSEPEAKRLVLEGKAIVALNHGIHSTEVGASQAAMETAYLLASSQDPEVLAILDQTVVLLIPSHNPDGTQRVVEWYRKTVGTPYEGGAIPFLYHHYTGHDNNRDWYAFTQIETRLTLAYLYHRWHPQIVHDLHQMGSKGARMFVPPYLDPYEPNVDPALIAAVNGLGAQVAARLTSEGKPGVLIHGIFDAWTPARAYPHTHGGVRLLSESAAARMATPLEVRFEELERGLGYDPKRASWNFPDPWRGGLWRLRDVVNYQLSANRAVLAHAASNREYWLSTFLAVNRRASSRSAPYAFVIPSPQRDPWTRARLLETLRLGEVEIHRARTDFVAQKRTFAAGSQVVLLAQPAGSFAKAVLEAQSYPDLRPSPGAPPQRPYDVTAHTLPLLMGVEVVEAREPFEADLEPQGSDLLAPGQVSGRGRFFAFTHKIGDLLALGRLLREGIPVRWATKAFAEQGRTFEAGTLLVPRSARPRLEALARELGVSAQGVDSRPPSLTLRLPRVGLYQSFVASMDEGWTRFLFERQVGLPYATLGDREVRAGRLRSRFDVIVLPDQLPSQILNGHAAGSLPDEYTGGLGKQGVAALKVFVQEGGTLVALNAASKLLIEEFALPVTDGLPALARDGNDGQAAAPPAFYAPGSILRASLEGESPLGHGLEATTPLWFESGPAFDAREGQVVLRYRDKSPLLSGYLLGEHLEGRAALVEVRLGRGKVVLFGFRPQYRGQSWATYVPFLNALFLSAADSDR